MPKPKFARKTPELLASEEPRITKQKSDGGKVSRARVATTPGRVLSKLDHRVKNHLLAAFASGVHPEIACGTAGISPVAFGKWLRRGAEDELQYLKMEEAGTAIRKTDLSIEYHLLIGTRKVFADVETEAVSILRRAGSDDWRAALSYLERRHPERWRLQTESKSAISVQGTVQHLIVSHKIMNEDDWLKEFASPVPTTIADDAE